ncbi:MAG: LysR family transcriptional regulator, partial [Rhodobacteraceae bacterium]|nr:LysR family transcriptional regulator [Paracoccaceae bacterium]
MYTAHMHPDLYFETLGEIPYRMISTEAERIAEVTADRYILTNFSPAYGAAHAALLPHLSEAAVSSGESTTVAGLLLSLGGSAYVIEEMAQSLIASGTCRMVRDAPPILQTVHAGVHLRNRHRPMHRRLLHLLRAQFAGRRLSERIRAAKS